LTAIQIKFPNAVLRNLQRTSDIVSRLGDRVFVRSPLTKEEFRVLAVLRGQTTSVNQQKIAQMLGRAPNTLSPLVFRMQGKGLVERSTDKRDRRVVKVSITPKANKLFMETGKVVGRVIPQLMDAITEEEQANLSEVLRKLELQAARMLSDETQHPETIWVNDQEPLDQLEKGTEVIKPKRGSTKLS